jgi:periplasmic protein TonB
VRLAAPRGKEVNVIPLPPPPKEKEPEPPQTSDQLPKLNSQPIIEAILPPNPDIETVKGSDPMRIPPVEGDQPILPPVNPRLSNNGGGTDHNELKASVRTAAEVNANACDKPDYPANSARMGETGTVTLSMLIGVDGRVIDANVEKSSGSRALDRAAKDGLSLCKFKPGTIDGVPQQSWTKIQYQWTLD